MRNVITAVLIAGLVLAGCGGADDQAEDQTTHQAETTEPQEDVQDATDGSEVESEDQPTDSTPSDSEPAGDSDEPTPEGSGPLPPDSIRIGEEIFERMFGASLSDCFVQEGAIPFSINGALNDDDRFRFSVDYVEDGVYEASISNDEIFWVAAPMREGTELDVEWDVDAQTISGTGLFNDSFRGLWAYGSFQFTCSNN